MATVYKWTPFGVALDITATGSNVVRTSATTFTVLINASWETYYNNTNTTYGMSATSGGVTKVLSAYSNAGNSSGSASFTGTYSISGNGSATKTITVTFKNYNANSTASASNNVTFNVTVPAWTSYTISYNANGGSGAPSSQTKWKDQALTLSSAKPTREGHAFLGWSTSSTATTATYSAGGSYTANAGATLYAVWKPDTYLVTFNANGGTGAPSTQTKIYGTTLKLSTTKPTRDRYNFLGWGTAASATTVVYEPGDNYVLNAPVTLYAIWELAYVKPTIYNLTVSRCDFNGDKTDTGTNALVEFEWKTVYEAALVNIDWYSVSLGSDADYFDINGTYGSVRRVIGFDNLSLDSAYTIYVTVYDSGGSFTATATLNGSIFPIDCLAGGKGVSFGKPAELGADESLGGKGVAEFAYDAKFNEPVYGNVLGLNRLPTIPEYSDLNDYLTTGCWAIHSNADAATVTCGGVLLGSSNTIPPARACRIEVYSSTGEGIRSEQWSYLRQRVIPYNAENPIWERDIARGENNVWVYYDWWRSSLTPAVSEKVYSKSAITVALSSNTALGIANAYTHLPLNTKVFSKGTKLTLDSGHIRIGENVDCVKISAQALVSPKSAGNRHIRIQKISGDTTTSIAWNCLFGNATQNIVLAITPVIVSVKEGDLIRMVFYTVDATDSNQSGSAANGWQTYMTVEEL